MSEAPATDARRAHPALNPRSIRFRLIVWYAGLLTLVMLCFAGYTLKCLDYFMKQVLTDALTHRGRQIAQTLLVNAAKTGDAYVRDEIEARYAPALNDRFVRITRNDASPLYISNAPNDHSFDPAGVPAYRLKESEDQIRTVTMRDQNRLLVVAIPFQAGPDRYLVEVGGSLAGGGRVLRALTVSLLVGLPVVIGLVVFGGHVLMRRALQPVERLMNAAQEITLHHLSRRLPVRENGDEIDHLSRALNQMIARLDESFQHTSRFTADASHELRTPLTIVRGELEALLFRDDVTGKMKEALASLLEEVERLVKIVEGLFALSRLDTGEAQTERVRFDLADLAETTAEQMCLLAEEKHIALSCEMPTRVEVDGDRARLKQVVVNLLDNAIKYTPAGGRISMSVQGLNGLALLEVADSGPGIPDAALPFLFERFFRADDVRSREIGGAGLGLSIVRSICAAHGGTASVRNEKPQGCRFTVTLPRSR